MGIANPYKNTISEGDNYVLSLTFQDNSLFDPLHSPRPCLGQSQTILPSLAPKFNLKERCTVLF